MTHLAIETSHARGSLALVGADGDTAELVFPEGLVHAREIAAAIDRLLRGADTKIDDLTGIAVGLGPGSYTGCRVGVTTAKTLALVRRLPVLAVSSLEILAAGLAPEARGPGRIAAVLDARRGSFYAALFGLGDDGEVDRIAADRVLSGAELIELLAAHDGDDSQAWLVGDGADAVLELASAGGIRAGALERGPCEADLPRAAVLARLAREPLAAAEFDVEAVHRLEPAYLRPSRPEIVWEARRAGEQPR